ncbi:MAG TPA: hypothetical protein VG755_18320 [Nannocystaceae bacterium]|nr:hypothetical protein [Nannocystaceae bacterium]
MTTSARSTLLVATATLATLASGCFDPTQAALGPAADDSTGSVASTSTAADDGQTGPVGSDDATTDEGDSSSTGAPNELGHCGDGVLDDGELCDLAELDGKLCASLGFGGGTLRCADDCTFDTSECDACGNGSLDADEVCDGTAFADASSCYDVGLGDASEPLSCTRWCTLDFGACSACGDGMVMEPEACEPGLLDGATCESLGFDGGELSCTAGCAFDLGGCEQCGNGTREGDEACDGNDVPSSCAAQGAGEGTLQCAADCTFDTSACEACGDGSRGGSEACDGDDLGGASCVSQGFEGGALDCAADCTFDVSGCDGGGCGDGELDVGEECDGSVGAHTCMSETGLSEGDVTCSAACTLDTSDCSAPAVRRVFVTSGHFSANFGGVAGADATCQGVADGAGLDGTFAAWISDGTSNAADRLVHFDGPYQRLDGTTIANDWDDLVDGNLFAAIGITETGAPVNAGATTVATATTAAGMLQVFNGSCSNWSTNVGGSGGVGNEENTVTWSESGAAGCATLFSLYCFEQ